MAAMPSPTASILLGAVAYHPKVVTIWEGMREHFRRQGVTLDYALFSTYERQVESLLDGHIDVAWNTPLAHVRVKRRTGGASAALGMRDSDRDFHAKVVVRRQAGIRALADLAGKRLAVGASDSPQGRILPLHFLAEQGIDRARVQLVPFEGDPGKHGDTGGTEREVLRALADGRADAGVVGDLIWVSELAAGHVPTGEIEVLWTTPGFDHCMFDGRVGLAPEQHEAFRRALFAMRWDDPEHRRLMELEGLRSWLPPREEGYLALERALDREQGW
jgi:ABC-type phosphate/phosphonate transport system substrate-binding protein